MLALHRTTINPQRQITSSRLLESFGWRKIAGTGTAKQFCSGENAG